MVDVAAGSHELAKSPQWAQRRQLIRHLLLNDDRLIYLRGSVGSERSHFLASLLEWVGQEFDVERLDDLSPRELADHCARFAAEMTSVSLGRAGLATTGSQRPKLLVRDNADDLSVAALHEMKTIVHRRGRILLAGRGGPAALADSDFIRWIDLAPSTQEPMRWSPPGGVPDPADRSDSNRNGRSIPKKAITDREATGRFLLRPFADGWTRARNWLGVGLLVMISGWVIWAQDDINRWFGGQTDHAENTVGHESNKMSAASTGQKPTSDAVVDPPFVGPRPVEDAARPQEAPKVKEPTDHPPFFPFVAGTSKPPRVDLPMVEILREVSREPWSGEASVVDIEELRGTERAPPNEGAVAQSTPQEAKLEGATALALPQTVPDKPIPTDSPTATPTTKSPPPSVAPLGLVQAPSELPGNASLLERPASHYTLQLVGARNVTSIHKLIRRHGLQGKLALFASEFKGRPWFALLYGDFPDRRTALAERAKLPDPLAKDAWPRSLASIRKLIK